MIRFLLLPGLLAGLAAAMGGLAPLPGTAAPPAALHSAEAPAVPGSGNAERQLAAGDVVRRDIPRVRDPVPGDTLWILPSLRHLLLPGPRFLEVQRATALSLPRRRFLAPWYTTALDSTPLDRIRTSSFLDEEGDLAFRVRALGEFGGNWTRFRPCDASLQGTCNPGLFPQLQPDILLGVEAAGSVGDRVFLDIDYDQTREFGGANRFRIYYQGQDDELLQRLEVGDVTFALPETRFLTRGIPAGNFGVVARGRVGGVDLQTVFAQQQGARESREFRLGSVGGEIGVVQDDSVVVEDADYARRQFFFLADPLELDGAPHVDVLALQPGAAPPHLAPGPEPIQLYRMERDPVLRQQVEGYIRADAEATGEEGVVRESGWFRYLRPGQDYYQHPSGLWVALRTPLQPGEALAVSYIASSGDSIGEYNPEAAANRGEVPNLRLVAATRPQHQPGRPTWDHEMKQVYRISGSDEVDLDAVQLTISLGEESGGRTFKQAPGGRRIPLLRLFGLDEDAPADRLDRRALFQPAGELIEDRSLPGTYLVFPTLRPFMEPPPVRSEGLDAGEALDVLGGDANRRIYESTDPQERAASGLYRLNLDLSIRSSGVTSTLVLGAFGVREGSERVFLGDRILRPEIDYLIDYPTGIITLLQPEGLLARSSSDRIQVSWEQASVFRTAPTSVVGASAAIPVGHGGVVDVMGIYQTERAIVNRPRFGAEPGALGMVGVRSRLDYDVPALDAFLSRLPGLANETPSRLSVDGELAFSLPDPNVSGDAYLDDFDAGDERSISLLSREWHLGSRLAFRTGAENALPQELDASNVASLVWQHNWIQETVLGDSTGVFEGFFSQDEIDRQIGFAGSQTREVGLRLTFGEEQGLAFGGNRWRSITTLLSPSGLDLTQTEYLDFYVAEGDALTLVLDLGMVSEDAYFVDEAGRTGGFRDQTGRAWGQGVLDQEADPLRGEVWNRESDERGLWPEACEAEPGRIYRVGDPRANCTRRNGRRDTEDLNQNGVLDTDERSRRYVVRLDGSSPYMLRDRAQTGTRFRLYRIPLRGPGALNPGGAFTEADRRSVQFLRLTVAGSRAGELTLARMRLVGSRWVKRSVDGVLQGIIGDTLALGGDLEVTPVSVLTEGEAYQAPPGVISEIDDPAQAVGGRGIEFNEKSLALRFDNLAPGTRAEVYSRFLQRARNFLNYRQLRVWALARSGDWGRERPTDFFLKIGSDPENFYLYRSRLTPAPDPQGVAPTDWLPEHVIHFGEWTELRRLAEERLLLDPPGPNDPPVTIWSTDSTHAVVLRDRARAPNLAAVGEISMGVWNRGEMPVQGELWVNELRLSGGARSGGAAQVVNMELDGGDLFHARLGYTGQNPDFRQMDQMATFQSDGAISMGGTMQFGRMLPEAWGMDLPISVSHERTSRDPFFLSGTDIRADLLPGLRAPGYNETRLGLALSTAGETGVGWLDRILPGTEFRMSVARSTGTTVTSETSGRSSEVALTHRWRPEERTVAALPEFLEPIARIFLPPGMVRRLREVRVRWSPWEVSAGSGIRHRERSITRFDEILATVPVDDGFRETSSESWLDHNARLEMRPLTELQASITVRGVRDLVDPLDLARGDPGVLALIESEQESLLGQNLGWETDRVVEGRVTYRPPLPPWLRADLGLQTRYRSDRNAGLVRFPDDRPPELLRNAGGERDFRASFTLEPAGFLRNGEGEGEEGGAARRLAEVLSPVTVTLQDGITSWFYREAVDPGAAFQLGIGDMGSFRSMDSTTATTLVDRSGLTAGTGLRFGDGLFAQVNFQQTDITFLDRRSQRTDRSTYWPDLRAGVSSLPLPQDWEGIVERVSFSSGWQRVQDRVGFGEAVIQQRFQEESRVPLEMVVEWGRGVSTRYRGLLGSGSGQDPTGITERTREEHGFAVETRLVPRGGLSERIQEPLRLSFVVNWAAVTECRVTSVGDECVPFLDRRDRSANLALATLLSDFEVGGQLSLLDRRSLTGMQIGQTQFQLAIWARLVFEAGPQGLLRAPIVGR
ncbi:MAG: hypothetical protein WD960_06800 [Gemmatimonadota bacterium]